MKIPVKVFYADVIGSPDPSKHSTETAVKAMKRWGVELVLAGEGTGSRKYHNVDLADLDKAKAAFAAEEADRLARKAGTGHKNGAPKVDVAGRLATIEELLQAIGVTVENINSRTYKWEKDAERKAAAEKAEAHPRGGK